MARCSAGRQRTAVAERGEIWLVSLDPTQRHAQQGRRPVLVASPGAFNRLTNAPIVLPITTGGNFVRTRGFAGHLPAPVPGPPVSFAAINRVHSLGHSALAPALIAVGEN